jgi:general secretion pathway protein G
MRFGVWFGAWGLALSSAQAYQSLEDTTRLTMGEVNMRIDLYSIKRGPPASLADVYGDKEVPRDSWGNAFVYVTPGPDGSDYDLISYGSDGSPGSSAPAWCGPGGSSEDIRWSAVK